MRGSSSFGLVFHSASFSASSKNTFSYPWNLYGIPLAEMEIQTKGLRLDRRFLPKFLMELEMN